jgi:anti-sigma factor RsiW
MNEMHTLTGAYAAGALDDSENEAFADHLLTCAACGLEVRELVETTALLGVAAAATPPPRLRASVMAEVARTRQLSPAVVSLADRAHRTGRPLRRWGLSAAACLAVFSVGLGSYAWRLHNDNSDLRHRGEQIAALATARDAHSVTVPVGGGTATVTLSRSRHEVEFLSSGLAALPSGRTYEIWLIDAAGAHPAGTFTTNHGRHAPQLFPEPGDATTLAVTEEPSGGSLQPTTTPILKVPLPA